MTAAFATMVEPMVHCWEYFIISILAEYKLGVAVNILWKKNKALWVTPNLNRTLRAALASCLKHWNWWLLFQEEKMHPSVNWGTYQSLIKRVWQNRTEAPAEHGGAVTEELQAMTDCWPSSSQAGKQLFFFFLLHPADHRVSLLDNIRSFSSTSLRKRLIIARSILWPVVNHMCCSQLKCQ